MTENLFITYLKAFKPSAQIKNLLCLGLLCLSYFITSAQPNLVKAEYFFDTDPGFGQGTNIAITPAPQILNQGFSTNVASLSPGIHQIYIRVQDANGKWSITNKTFLYKPKDSTTTALSSVARAELFFDIDPGFGKGTSIPITPGVQILNADFSAIIDSLSLGAHQMFLRVQDADGKWSIVSYRIINVCQMTAAVADFSMVEDNNKVSFINASKHAILYRWFLGNGDSSNLESPYQEYAPGNYSIRLIASNPCGIDTMSRNLTIEGLDNITPASCGNTGAATVRIKGFGFVPGTTIRIVKGSTALTIVDTLRVSDELIRATLNLMGAATGAYDVEVQIPGHPLLRIVNGFNVAPGIKPSFTLTTNMQSAIRIGNPTMISFTVTNNGNINAHAVPVMFSGLPENAIVRLLNDTIQFPASQISDSSFQVDDFVLTDSINHEKKVPIIIPKLCPGESQTVRLEITAYTDFTAKIQVYDPMLTSSPIDLAEATACKDCIEEYLGGIARKITEDVIEVAVGDWGACIAGGLSLAYELIKQSISQANKDPVLKDAVGSWISFSGGALTTAIDCAEAITETVLPEALVIKMLIKTFEAYDTYSTYVPSEECVIVCMKTLDKLERTINARVASDPNIKTGPGSHTNSFIDATDLLAYTIMFENKSTATLPAQRVVITDTLDLSKIELSTFNFTGISAGAKFLSLNDSRFSFVKDIDLRPVVNYKVRVIGFLDTTSGVIRVEYQTIDTSTNQLTTDPLSGFLLPNDNDHNGEGSFSFHARRKLTVTESMQLSNRASIVFDFNPPIVTEPWLNRFDFTKPVSTLQSLPGITPSDTIILKWTGTDALSGIRSYDLFISVNDSAFRPLILNTNKNQDTVLGEFGNTYKFFVIATDSANNTENMKNFAEAVTAIYYMNKPQVKLVSPLSIPVKIR